MKWGILKKIYTIKKHTQERVVILKKGKILNYAITVSLRNI